MRKSTNDQVLSRSFFERDSHEVARELLGKNLVRQFDDGTVVKLRVNEVEVYDGFEDQASHASKGLTERTKIMYGNPGHWYIYLIYGIYWMINITTREADYPAALLIRGAGEYDGPGKLSRFLAVDKSLNGLEADKESGMWFENADNVKIFRTGPRVGVSYAGEEWAGKHWRYFIGQ